MMHIGNEWDALLADEIQKDYYLKLRQFLISEYTTRRIYPPMEDIFQCSAAYFLQRRKGCYTRSGSLPRPRTGARYVFLSKKGNSAASVIAEHILSLIHISEPTRPY